MCPVFTPFSSDKWVFATSLVISSESTLFFFVVRKTINCAIIEKYACYLKQKGIKGVLVNGTTGEGTCLSVVERKCVTEEWVKVCRKFEMVCMVQIGGTCIADVYELAEHAEKFGVCAVLCLPDLFFRPTCEEDLVDYIKNISYCCPTRPMYYYHYPAFTGVECKWISTY